MTLTVRDPRADSNVPPPDEGIATIEKLPSTPSLPAARPWSHRCLGQTVCHLAEAFRMQRSWRPRLFDVLHQGVLLRGIQLRCMRNASARWQTVWPRPRLDQGLAAGHDGGY